MIRTTLVAVLVALGLLMTAWAAETPKGVGSDYDVSYQGKVVDELGQPLKDAKVALIGTPLSAVTDTAGAFKIQGVARRGAEIGAAPGVPAVGESAERFCPLEVTAGGCVARTILPDAAKMDGMTVALWAMPVEGQPADLGRFAYNYRKGAWDNPSETQFLKPPDNMFRGFLWEEHRAASRVEVEFAKGQTVPKAEELGVVSLWGQTWWGCPPMTFPAAPGKGTLYRKECSLVGTPRTTDRGTTVLTFRQDLTGSRDVPLMLGVFYAGADKNAGIPAVRVYGQTTTRENKEIKTVDIQWGPPRVVEVEWGFQADKPCDPLSGRIECYNGHVGKIEALEADNGLATLGEHHWRESSAAPGKRRGFSVKVFPTNGGKVAVTLWTSGEALCVALDDLKGGPILVPSTGYFVTLTGSGVSARQFHEQLAAKRGKTVRQQVREEPEKSLIDVLAQRYPGKDLPKVPVPPFGPPMQIDVPDRIVAGLWPLYSWDIQDATAKMNAAIDPEDLRRRYRAALEGKDPALNTGENVRIFSIYGRNLSFGSDLCALENHAGILAMDLVGKHDYAEGGLNFWLTSKKPLDLNKCDGLWYDTDGFLLISNYDARHAAGHGDIMRTAVRHYYMSNDEIWLASVTSALKKACEWTLRQQHQWGQQVGPRARCYGLQPPSSTDDCNQAIYTASFPSLLYYEGLKAVSDVLAKRGVDGADVLVKGTEIYRKDLRMAGHRLAALCPVMKISDGTYRRFIPSSAYHRGVDGFGVEFQGGMSFVKTGVYDARETIADDILDVLEERLIKNGAVLHCGYGRHTWMYLLSDDVPLYLRAAFNSTRGPWGQIQPFEGYEFKNSGPSGPGGYEGGRQNNGYVFQEAVILENIRNLLVFEIGDELWLARATPRTWLEQGKKISVKNAPTHFGTLTYEIVSDVDNGKISATVEMPSRKAPKEVVLRFRHPKSAPIKGVTVNGKPWTEFNKGRETITLKDLTGTVNVTAQY